MKPSSCRFITVHLLISLTVLLSSCANKAKLIQAGAAQFESESLAAIRKIDELRQKEIGTAPLSKEKASAFFVTAVKNSSRPIDRAALKVLEDPTGVAAQGSDAGWQLFLENLRMQYSTFANTFASLDRGGLLGAPRVPETIPVLDKLIAQMVATASSIGQTPAEFIGERAAIAAELEELRSKKPYDDITDVKLLDIERRFRAITASEGEITRDTMEQALKAAKLGSRLRILLINYENLTVDDIAEGLSVAFRLAGTIPGLDIGRLQTEADNIAMEINSDPELKGFLDSSLSQINAARSNSR
jgi:hypothetical protein